MQPLMRVRIEGDVGRPLQLACATRIGAAELEADPSRLAEFLMHVYARTSCRELAVLPAPVEIA